MRVWLTLACGRSMRAPTQGRQMRGLWTQGSLMRAHQTPAFPMPVPRMRA